MYITIPKNNGKSKEITELKINYNIYIQPVFFFFLTVIFSLLDFELIGVFLFNDLGILSTASD